jgi:2-keto-4-pentenoate hydratase
MTETTVKQGNETSAVGISSTGISAIDRDRLYQASEILLEARRTVTPITELPVKLRPTTLTEAYFLQDIIIAELGEVAGWKVGASSPDAVPVFGPMFDFGVASNGSLITPTMRRMRGIEAEIAFLMGHDLPPRDTAYTREEVIAAIASAHPAIELLESAYVDPDAVDRLSMIGDLQMHGGFVHGPAYPGWRDFDFGTENVTVSVDGAIRTDKGANGVGADILKLVVWLANEGQPRTGGLRTGQWITTGSWMGKTLATAGSSVRVHFDHFGDVTVMFEEHEPRMPRTEPVVLHN